ncbi:MAG: CinA family protein [Chloroflexi bacterium]|nr:MAG: CinA family protein [Chloroflexota bacterium]
MPPDPEVFALAQQVGERLRQRGQWLAVAESCTGGLLGVALTDVPGSSAYFLGGIISYADRVKVELLAVPESTLRQHGAVSEQAAAAMAEGVRQLLHADVGISITGVAGPDAEESKPAGLTFIGITAPTLPSPRGGGEVTTSTHRFQWNGDRWDNRRRSVIAALELLVRALEL